MSSKSIVKTTTVNANYQVIEEYTIANNTKWTIDLFGAADINMGDSKSTTYVLKFGDDILKIISVTGSTYESHKIKDIVGDGVKKLKIVINNNSSFSKICPYWVEGHSI